MTTRTAYDALGRVTSQTDPTGRTSRVEHDAAGRVTARIDPSGDRTSYTYDAADQLLSVTDPLGHTSTTTYDAVGRPVRVTDADGRHVTTSYDRAGRVVKVLRGDGSELTWRYDAVGQLTRTTDAAGDPATYTWDALGRQASYIDTAGRTSRYGYDADGRMTTVTQPDGAVMTFSYDAAGRRTSTDYSDTTPDVSTTYDAAGRVRQVLDGTGTVTYTRDQLGRVTTVDRAGTVVGYDYDTAGRVDTLTYPSGQQVQRDYDAAGRLTSVTDWAQRTYTYAYDADGAVEELRYPNGIATSYDTDDGGQTLAITTKTSSTSSTDSAGSTGSTGSSGRRLLELAYDYTPAGPLAEQSATRPGDVLAPTASPFLTASYTWDPLARLTDVAGSGAGAVTYDAAGSVTSLPDGRTLTYDTHRQVTGLTDPTADMIWSLDYDVRGNRTSSSSSSSSTGTGTTATETSEHTYDEANRLTRLNRGGSSTIYTYSANGLRASATTGTETREYVWDAMPEVAQLLSDGNHTYVYGLGAAPLAQIDDTGAVDYLHTDLLGSVRATTNATAEITSSNDYDPYGRPLTTTTWLPDVTKFGYAGEYTDPTGYIYLRNRYYDPTTAQFLTLDPLLQTTGDPYGYTAGNPLQFTDPTGLISQYQCLSGQVNSTTFGLPAGLGAMLQGCTVFTLDPDTGQVEYGGFLATGPQLGTVQLSADLSGGWSNAERVSDYDDFGLFGGVSVGSPIGYGVNVLSSPTGNCSLAGGRLLGGGFSLGAGLAPFDLQAGLAASEARKLYSFTIPQWLLP